MATHGAKYVRLLFFFNMLALLAVCVLSVVLAVVVMLKARINNGSLQCGSKTRVTLYFSGGSAEWERTFSKDPSSFVYYNIAFATTQIPHLKRMRQRTMKKDVLDFGKVYGWRGIIITMEAYLAYLS